MPTYVINATNINGIQQAVYLNAAGIDGTIPSWTSQINAIIDWGFGYRIGFVDSSGNHKFNEWYVNYEWFGKFDTTSIPLGETVNSVALNMGAAGFYEFVNYYGIDWSDPQPYSGPSSVNSTTYYNPSNFSSSPLIAQGNTNTPTSNNNFNTWIKKGGQTRIVGVSSLFTSNSSPTTMFLSSFSTPTITIITSAAAPSYNLIWKSV